MSNDKNKTELLIQKLKNIQTKLNTFETNYDSKFNHLEKRSRINNDLDHKTDTLKELQMSRITVDLGGYELTTSKQLIENCKFPSILQDLIVDNNKIFIDVPKSYFKRVLFIMRNKTKETKGNKLGVELTEKMTEDMMNEVIKKVFKGEECLKEVKYIKKSSENAENVMDYLWKKEIEPVVIPVVNNYNNYNNANYNRNYD